jgi:predicted O-linked N-acetylglucosamine transferase (SPINDLY family)
MNLLKAIDKSVLWILDEVSGVRANLQREALARGVDPARIIFAPRMDQPDHLARLRVADLSLDTFYCCAHTTASDALWAGLPHLTLLGETFAGRVAGSLLNAVGLPELIAKTPEEYEQTALELARDPARLRALRERLAANRLTHPLFDTPRFARHLEAAYRAMHARFQAGLPPDHIFVEPLPRS